MAISEMTASQFRVEEDALGDVQVPADHLWGAQTQRSHVNFPIGVERCHWGRPVIRALGVLKKCAALANGVQGNFQLNVYKPVMLHNVLVSIELLADACRSFSERCATGIQPNEKRIKEHLEHSLMLVTALNPHIGYEKAAKISLTAYREDISLREAALKLGFLTAEQFDSWVRPQDMTHPLAKGL